MSHVSTVIHTQPDGDDEVHAGDGVDGQAPEVHEPADIDEGDDDHE